MAGGGIPRARACRALHLLLLARLRAGTHWPPGNKGLGSSIQASGKARGGCRLRLWLFVAWLWPQLWRLYPSVLLLM